MLLMVYEILNFFAKNVIDLKVTKSPEIKMDDTRKKELESLATNFRNAIERCKQSCLPSNFKDFPHGS